VYLLQTGVLQPAGLAQILNRSAEHLGLEVNHLYQEILHRSPDAGGGSFWTSRLLAGVTEFELAVDLLSSVEYASTHATPGAFVAGLYADVLGRAPDAAGQAFWVQSGLSTGALARAFVYSAENDRRIVDRCYVEYLRRTADPSGEAFFTSMLQAGLTTPDTIQELFLGSAEYFANAH